MQYWYIVSVRDQQINQKLLGLDFGRGNAILNANFSVNVLSVLYLH